MQEKQIKTRWAKLVPSFSSDKTTSQSHHDSTFGLDPDYPQKLIRTNRPNDLPSGLCTPFTYQRQQSQTVHEYNQTHHDGTSPVGKKRTQTMLLGPHIRNLNRSWTVFHANSYQLNTIPVVASTEPFKLSSQCVFYESIELATAGSVSTSKMGAGARILEQK